MNSKARKQKIKTNKQTKNTIGILGKTPQRNVSNIFHQEQEIRLKFFLYFDFWLSSHQLLS